MLANYYYSDLTSISPHNRLVKSVNKILFLFISLLLFSCTKENNSEGTPFSFDFKPFAFKHRSTNTTIPYRLFKPQQSINSNEEFPLIIALHGGEYFFASEERFLTKKTTGYMALAWIEELNQKNYPAFVVAPNIHEGIWMNNEDYYGWDTPTSMDFIEQLLDNLVQRENIDPQRIYLTGHSMGGVGTWYIGGFLNHKIAAIVPLSSAFSSKSLGFDTIYNNNFRDLPVWSFIHKIDADGNESINNAVHGCRAIFKKLSDSSLAPVYTHGVRDSIYELTPTELQTHINSGQKHFYTEYYSGCDQGCHYAMTTALKNPLLFQWLFDQRLQ